MNLKKQKNLSNLTKGVVDSEWCDKFKTLSSLTNYANNKCIFIDNNDYYNTSEIQYLGEPFDYIKNKNFFKTYPSIDNKN